MTSTPATEVADRQDERKRKRGAVIKFSLAGAALLGIAAAATSAQWSDDAWFKGTATAADVNLQGSVDNALWADADTKTGALEFDVDGSLLGALNQGETKSVPLYLYNKGDQSLALTGSLVAEGGIFTDADLPTSDGGAATAATAQLSSTAGTVTDLPTTIAAGDHVQVFVVVKTSATWSKDFRGLDGDISVRFTGE